ncbi:MAG: hypothetical protein FWC80_03325 [Firmicutes bacterium]|nr:hypothetical protein [Bacillota bacterium]
MSRRIKPKKKPYKVKSFYCDEELWQQFSATCKRGGMKPEDVLVACIAKDVEENRELIEEYKKELEEEKQKK